MGRIVDIPTPRVILPILKPARYKALYGGRGGLKSHTFAELAIERCLMYPGTRGVCIREVQRSLKESVKLLIEDKIEALGVGSKFHAWHDRIDTPGGGVMIFVGMHDYTAETIKSLEGFDFGYVEEAQTLTARSLELLRPTIRKAGSELWFAWNPRHSSDPVDLFFRGPTPPPDSVIIRTSWRDNPWFPAELELERAFDEKNNPARYAHVWDGEYEPQAVGAIWSRDVIHRNRRSAAPALQRVIVSVDPPVSSEPGSDESGITVPALGEDGRGYVLDDVSCCGTPQQWAERAIAAYDLYEADAIVAEVNQGGEMVEHVIHSVRPQIRVIKVHASRGKHVRAEPIAALYSLDKISHVGAFPKLEAQMCLVTAAGYEGEGSPDRVDSLVHGFSELFPKMIRKTYPKDKPMPMRANSFYNPHRPRART